VIPSTDSWDRLGWGADGPLQVLSVERRTFDWNKVQVT
jgi:hypothetical protein